MCNKVVFVCLVALLVAMATVTAQQEFYDNFFGGNGLGQGRANGPNSAGAHHARRFARQLNFLPSQDKERTPGPVLFPQAPAGNPGETSGVVVGASGYGFVPPGSQSI